MLEFSIQKEARKLVPRSRYQRGSVKATGKRSKRWRLSWYVYLLQPDGTERRAHRSKTISAKKYSKTEAQQQLDAIILKQCGESKPDGTMTFDLFFQEIFLPTRRWAKATSTVNAGTYKKFVGPRFGAMELAEIRRYHIELFFNGLVGLGRSTLSHIQSLLHHVLSYAEENRYIDRNPMGTVKLSDYAKTDRATKVLTMEQARRVFAMPGETGLVFRLLLTLGLRVGELLALRWNDIHEDLLRIDESVESGGVTKCTKGGKVREVAIPAGLLQELQTRPYTGDEGFIFCSRWTGRCITNAAARERWLDEAKELSGIPTLDFHTCRRTCSTILKNRGMSTADVQAILGHANAKTTERHYIKPIRSEQRAAVVELFRDFRGVA